MLLLKIDSYDYNRSHICVVYMSDDGVTFMSAQPEPSFNTSLNEKYLVINHKIFTE